MLLVFPGQGSQHIGMGKDIYDAFASAREVFHEANDAVSQKLSDLIFYGNEEELRKTQNAQPALMTVSMAMMHVLKKEFDLDICEKARFLAGHSLGEYSALCAGQVISFSNAVKILKIRGEAMARAYPEGGTMAAVIGLDLDAVEKIANECSFDEEIVQIANDNSIGQVVISGHLKAVQKAIEKSLQSNAKLAKLLEVSGPFHSVLMKNAVNSLREILENTDFQDPLKPIITNVTAKAETNDFKELLLKQLTGRIRWRESILFAEANSVSQCIEIGAGKVLLGLIKRISPDMKLININSLESLENFAKSNCC